MPRTTAMEADAIPGGRFGRVFRGYAVLPARRNVSAPGVPAYRSASASTAARRDAVRNDDARPDRALRFVHQDLAAPGERHAGHALRPMRMNRVRGGRGARIPSRPSDAPLDTVARDPLFDGSSRLWPQ